MALEIHEASGLPMIEDGMGNMRVLGCLPPHSRSPFLMMSELFPVAADPSTFQELEIASWEPPYVSDQGDKSSCAGHATRCALDAAWTVSGFMRPPARFSGTYTYSWANGGQDAGAVISDICAVLKMHGNATIAEAPDNLVFRQQFARNADAVAANYKPQVIFKIPTYDDLLQCLAWGIPCVFGIMVGRNFMNGNLSSDGMAPLPDVQVGGHAMCAMSLRNLSAYGWVPHVQNSWSGRFGQNGRCFLRREHFARRIDAYGIVAVASAAGNLLVP